MLKPLVVVLLLTVVTIGKDAGKTPTHSDYVPDEKTAERIAEAVLVAQFGQERVSAQMPFHTASMSKDQWLVQGAIKDKEGRIQVGGAFGVWVNKHTGCVSVIEHTK